MALSSFGQQFPTLHLTNITEANGLSNNNVNSITQDDNGHIWIGTENGLNRYDGLRIKTYYKNDLPFKLDHSLILETYFMKGRLWISGLNQCSIFNLGDEKMKASVTYKKTCQIGAYHNDTILTGFTEFYSYNEKNGFTPFAPKSFSNKSYFKIFQYNAAFYLGYHNNKIDLIRAKDYAIVDSVVLDKTIQIQDMVKDNNGLLWFGTWRHGLFSLDLKNKKVTKLDLGSENSNVTKLFHWHCEDHWYIIASVNDRNGFVIVDEKTLKYRTMHQICFSKIEVPIFVNCIFEDKFQNLWFGTNQGIKLFSKQDFFKIHPCPTPGRTRPNKSQASSIHFLDNEIWVMKRYSEGLSIYDRDWQLKKHFPRLAEHTKFNDSECNIDEGFDLLKHHDNVYITSQCGLVKMNVNNNSSTILYPNGPDLPLLRAIVPFTEEACFIRSKPNKILRFDFTTDQFTKTYTLNDEQGKIVDVIHIYKSQHSENIYAISEDRLFLYNKTKDCFEVISGDLFKKYRMASISDDKQGILWISTYTGLLTYDPQIKKITNAFDDHSDMSYVLKSCADRNNNIWFNCQKGYWCWNQKKRSMVKFGYDLGLPDNRINAGITTDAARKIIYAGGEDAVIEFFPNAIEQYIPKSKTTITDILIDNTSQHIKRSTGNVKTIQLQANQRNLTMHFSVADFSMRENFEYFYQLNNEEWTRAERGQVSFNRLRHGTYNFKVKGIFSINGIEAQPDSIKIVVLPFWYETMWFYILLAISLCALLFLWYKRRILKIRQEDELKANYEKKLILMELSNLRSQMNPHFIFNALNSINGFIIENETRLASDYLTKFSRLVRMILENSKNENITLDKEIETLQLYLLIEGLRFDNKFLYKIHIDPSFDPSMVKIPPMVIQPFVENAIWHGILPQKSGKVTIFIGKDNVSNQLKVVIEDNGIGREKATALKTRSGSGNKSYGIAITKQRIESLSPKNKVEIIDLVEEGHCWGTRVELYFEIYDK